MVKTTVDVDGMMCNMCESHVNDAIRNNFQVKKVSSSHKTGLTEIVSEESLDKEKLTQVLKDLGYELADVKEEPYKKKGLFSFK